MSDGNPPLRHVVDWVVYAPIGLFTLAQRELPQLIAAGRSRVDSQLTLARFVGKMAVSRGKRELERRLDEAEQAREAQKAAQADGTVRLDAALPIAADAGSLPEVIIEAVADELEHDVDPDALPIEGYDSLAASQVVLRLGSLNGTELEAVRDYEAHNRNRRTVLGKISQLQAK